MPEEQKNKLSKKDKIEELKKECEEYKAGWQRAQADYKNLQTEIENNKAKWAKMSEVQILEEFIPVYDNLGKAYNSEQGSVTSDQNVLNWMKGLEMIMKQFENVFKSHGVEKIKTVGEQFNPELHEAVGEESAQGGQGGEEDGVVLKELEAGYRVGDRVLKAAKVIVAKK